MSLTSLIKEKDVNNKLNEIIPKLNKPNLGMPLAPIMKKRNDLVGIAFDYLLRFYIESINDLCSSKEWIASNLLTTINSPILEEVEFDFISKKVIGYKRNKTTQYVEKTLKKCKRLKNKFLKDKKITFKLLKYLLKISQFDLIFRSGIFLGYFRKVSKEDIKDLSRLASLLTPDQFVAKKYVILNPTFGIASELIGGADADLIIDSKLIEIKTVKSASRLREYVKQLIGYYLLLQIGSVSNISFNVKIDQIGIYFSRFNKMIYYNIKDFFQTKTKEKEYIEWFKERIMVGKEKII